MDRLAMGSKLADLLFVMTHDPEAPLPQPVPPSAWLADADLPHQVDLAPGIRVTVTGNAHWEIEGDMGGVAFLRAPEHGAMGSTPEGTAQQALRQFMRGQWPLRQVRGRYLFLAWNAQTRSVRVANDGFRTYPLHFHATPEALVCSTDLGLLLRSLPGEPRCDPLAIYHYLNFAFIPSPSSPVVGVAKLPPEHLLEWPPLRITAAPCAPSYTEDLQGTDAQRAQALRESMIATVTNYLPSRGTPWGTYLSGGTDSSSIAGILARFATDGPFDTFSIGFQEGEFDERRYAALASRAYGLRNHSRDVGEADAVAAIPRLARAFDEPFGNSSAIGSLYCADLARADGKRVLLAGDGGDEIFGGNERYAKDQVFHWYQHAPRVVQGMGRCASAALAPLDGFHLANRLRRMEARGRMSNPDRFYSDTAFASTYFDRLLDPTFRSGLFRNASLELVREIYAAPKTTSDLNRLLYVDLRLTIADSDLVKVIRTAGAAGVDVVFPYLDRELVEFTGRLPETDKLRGLEKRWLFKRAMADILPVEIQRKKKQGFGMPVRDWLRHGGQMRELLRETILSPRALERGYFQPRFVRQLIEWHESGSWDYSSELYRLLMLELWHREHIDGHR
jgi:asparagine synthase (glutamine-hydrolysing)